MNHVDLFFGPSTAGGLGRPACGQLQTDIAFPRTMVTGGAFNCCCARGPRVVDADAPLGRSRRVVALAVSFAGNRCLLGWR